MRLTIPLLTCAVLTSACGGGGSAPADTPPVLPAPTVTLTAAPASLDSGASSMLTWSSTNATACTASGAWSGAVAANGTQATGALMASATFSLICSGTGGSSTPATVTVTVTAVAPPPAAPTATLTAYPTSLAAGSTSTLSWQSTNATACTASGGWSGPLAVNGSLVTAALTSTTVYSIVCSGAGGSSAASQTVTVVPAPTVALTAASTSLPSGGATTLNWQSTNATACTASGGSISGPKPTNGSQGTGALTASTAYSMTCSGIGGTGIPARVTVTVAAAAPTILVSPRAAGITLMQTQQFTATVTGGPAPAWSVDGVAGGNAAVGTIGSSGLYRPGGTAGAHTVTAVSGTATGTATIGVTDLAGVLTYHNDTARDGTNSQEYALSAANVKSGSFGKLKSCTVDGAVYGQPLWLPNVTLGTSQHNVVFVATQHDSVYAFDADNGSCTALWQVSLLDANHGGAAGETAVPGTLVGAGYGDIAPEIGVTGTAVIDPSTGTLYVVSKSINALQTVFYQRLHALDVTTGLEQVPPATIGATVSGAASGTTLISFNAQQEAQRAGLALAGGVVYVAWASHEDEAPYFGWMMGYRMTGGALSQTAMFNAATHTGKAGIWMSGGAPAADTSGNLYVVTGNGIFDMPNGDYGDSLLKLTGSLNVSDSYTPADQANDNTNDEDFGAGGAAVLADLTASSGPAHLLICGGKTGSFYVLNRDSLGGYDVGVTHAVQVVSAGGSLYATGSFWNGHYYIGNANGHIESFTLNAATSLFGTNPSSSSPATIVLGSRGGTPSITAAGTANGILWVLDSTKFCTSHAPGCGPVVLHAFDATNLATELWNSAANAADAAGYAVKFTVPTVANGKVYVGTRGNNAGGADASTSIAGELDIYALTP